MKWVRNRASEPSSFCGGSSSGSQPFFFPGADFREHKFLIILKTVDEMSEITVHMYTVQYMLFLYAYKYTKVVSDISLTVVKNK